jgi:hypothetical protein
MKMKGGLSEQAVTAVAELAEAAEVLMSGISPYKHKLQWAPPTFGICINQILIGLICLLIHQINKSRPGF